MKLNFFILILLAASISTHAQKLSRGDLELVDPSDYQLLEQQEKGTAKDGYAGVGESDTTVLSDDELESIDDLEALKEDIGEISYDDPNELKKQQQDLDGSKRKPKIANQVGKQGADAKLIFDIGKEEKELLEVSKLVQNRIPKKEWNELSKLSTSGSYTVVTGDWLWKIAGKLFGSGFYYPKIWSLNPYITNPHKIEAGMVLLFDTGDAESLPQIRLGSFSDMETDESV
ncbi:LysM peptidoglycan-binding domain-containing protein [Bacteriovoracaceae bacterium]|nr:LysM peptidoglycan-binding domain-containing protein [Bacteriovoracaceae bacterium]